LAISHITTLNRFHVPGNIDGANEFFVSVPNDFTTLCGQNYTAGAGTLIQSFDLDLDGGGRQ